MAAESAIVAKLAPVLTLDHEVFDYTMKLASLETKSASMGTQLFKVFGCLWNISTEQPNHDTSDWLASDFDVEEYAILDV